MAEAFTNRFATERGIDIRAESAGTITGERVNPIALVVMREVGVPMDTQRPKQLTQAMADRADRVVTMGCGVDAAACPNRSLIAEDWGLDDPAGQSIDKVREIRDQIRERVGRLLNELGAQS